MGRVAPNTAEIEYAVTLAVLNFQTEFMKTTYSRVQVHVFDELIEVILTRATSIPAEDELTKTLKGRMLLRQFHQATFESCRNLLRKRIEHAVGAGVQSLIADFDPSTGRNTIIIRLQESFTASTSCQPIG